VIDPDTATVLLDLVGIVDEIRQFGDVRSHGERIRRLREQLTAAQHVHAGVRFEYDSNERMEAWGAYRKRREWCSCGFTRVVRPNGRDSRIEEVISDWAPEAT